MSFGEGAQCIKREITGLEIDNEKLQHENRTLKSQIDEFKSELYALRSIDIAKN